MYSYKLAIRCMFVFALCVCGHVHGFAEGFYAQIFGNGNTIHHSDGGVEGDFMWAAADVLESGRRVKIDGACLSACAVFADFARPNVCITKRTVFGFHLAKGKTPIFSRRAVRSGMPFPGYKIRFQKSEGEMSVSPEIKKWVEEHGGWHDRMLLMNSKEASKFWPTCK